MSSYSKIIDADPSDDQDYGIDWTAWLGADTIATSTWTITPSGPTKHDESNSTTTTTVWVTGGTAGQSYRVTNRIVTSNSPARTKERTILLRVDER